MGTKISAASAILPSAVATGDIVPVSRSGGSKGKIDLRALLPPGFAYTQNAANSAEFKSLVLDNDTGFSASPGSVESTSFRISQGNWNSTDGTYGPTQTKSNSGLAIGFNCKSVEIGQEFRVDTAKHGLGIFFDSNHVTGFGQTSEFAVRFKNKEGTAYFEALRFVFGNSTADAHTNPGEYLQDARIGVSGVRGARGCDFLGWTNGATMGWAGAGTFNADVFIASIRRNELLFYHDPTPTHGGATYPFINMRLRQADRFTVRMDFGMAASSDPSPNNYNTTPQIPTSMIKFGSRPYNSTYPNASQIYLGLSDTTLDATAKEPFTAGASPAICAVYTGNAQAGTKGIVIRGGARNTGTGSPNAGHLFEVQSTADYGATGTMTWAFGSDGTLICGSTQRTSGVGTNSFTPTWKIPGGGAPAQLEPTWLHVYSSQGGSKYYVPAFAN